MSNLARCRPLVCLALLATSVAAQEAAEAQAAAPKRDNWPQFRGAFARGVADTHATPTEWNIAKGTNVAWKTPIPGLAHSSPVIWGDRIYLTTAVKEGEAAELTVGLYGAIAPVENEGPHDLQVLCVDKKTGEIQWTKTAWHGEPAIPRHTKGSHAASTPATDGERVVAFFGSEGLYCYDMDGELLWKKDFGVLDSGFYMMPKAQWGFASSPILHDGRVYVQCDVQKDSFVAALDATTGEEIWRTARDETPGWGTPTVHVTEARSQLIVNGYKNIGGYDLATGKQLWKMTGGGDIPVPTPVVAHDLVFITNAHGKAAPIVAVSTAATGEFTIEKSSSEHLVWGERRGGNYMQTPLVYGDLLFCCRDNSTLTCMDATTGEQFYRQRIEPGVGFTASGVAADGKLYFTSEEGEVYVLSAGTKYEELAVNEMGETCMATPAISAGVLYFRTRGHLVAIAEAK